MLKYFLKKPQQNISFDNRLVCGDVEGKLNDLYSKVKSIQAKAGKFDVIEQ